MILNITSLILRKLYLDQTKYISMCTHRILARVENVHFWTSFEHETRRETRALQYDVFLNVRV